MVTAKKATGPFETQVGREKFPVGEGGGMEEGRKSCIITFTDFWGACKLAIFPLFVN